MSQRIHFLITAILRVNDLWMSNTPQSFSDFFELVKEFFDSQDISYSPNISIPGKTIEHPIDFLVPLKKGKENLIKLMGSPKKQSAKLISFTWLDIQELRPASRKIVILNDVSPDADNELKTREMSDDTISILEAYSHNILKWSERGNTDINQLLGV